MEWLDGSFVPLDLTNFSCDRKLETVDREFNVAVIIILYLTLAQYENHKENSDLHPELRKKTSNFKKKKKKTIILWTCALQNRAVNQNLVC